MTITIIDDDESIRESLPDLLRELGHVVRVFASAEAFLAADAEREPGILIVDVAMGRMSGPELQRELLRRGDPDPIIFMTAHSNEQLRRRVLNDGAVAWLFKPFTESELIEALDRALGKP